MSTPPARAARSPFHKYWVILSTRTQEDMAYRANYVFGALFRFLPLVTTLFLWYAIYQTRKSGGAAGSIRGMSYEDMVAYYALMYVARGFSSMPGTMRDISLDIKDGLLNRYLIRPMDYLWYQVMYRLAHKVVFWYVALFTFPPVFLLMRHYFSHRPTPAEWAAFAGSLLIAFWIGLLFCFIIGTLAFWFLEISTFLFVVMTMEFFLSGHLVPLNLLPASLQPLLAFSPFGYEGYWPCMILMGKVPDADLPRLLGTGLLWVGGFYLLTRLMWRAGLKRYSAVGG
jgi:viologen exporter family transport system permease protein